MIVGSVSVKMIAVPKLEFDIQLSDGFTTYPLSDDFVSWQAAHIYPSEKRSFRSFSMKGVSSAASGNLEWNKKGRSTF